MHSTDLASHFFSWILTVFSELTSVTPPYKEERLLQSILTGKIVITFIFQGAVLISFVRNSFCSQGELAKENKISLF